MPQYAPTHTSPELYHFGETKEFYTSNVWVKRCRSSWWLQSSQVGRTSKILMRQK